MPGKQSPYGMDDLIRIAKAMDRAGKRGEMIRVEIHPRAAFEIASTIQGALRHPRYPLGLMPRMREFVNGLGDRLGHIDPMIADMLVLGWDPDYDIPSPGEEGTVDASH